MPAYDVDLSFARAQSLIGGLAGGVPYQSATSATTFLTIGANGYVLTSNGSVPGWSLASGITSGASAQVQTTLQAANTSYFLTFVDTNNATATAETVYTTSTFTINPTTGFVGIGSQDGASPLNVRALSTLTGTINNFQKIFTTQASGGNGNNVYRSEWRRRRAAGTDWTTQNIHDGIWVDASFTTPGTDTRTWWDRDPSTPSQAWGDQATTWMFANSTGLGVGTTSISSKLEILGTGGSTPALSLNATEAFSASPLNYLQFKHKYNSAGAYITGSSIIAGKSNSVDGDTQSSFSVFTRQNGSSQTERFKIDGSTSTIFWGLQVGNIIWPPGLTSGEIRAAGEITAYYSSDIRLKENIRLISDPITIVEQIRGVYFDWTDEHIAKRGGEDGYFVRKHDIGVIAQEVEAVLPDLVAERDDGTKVVKYEKLVALLIEAIKEQQKQINQISQALEIMANK